MIISCFCLDTVFHSTAAVWYDKAAEKAGALFCRQSNLSALFLASWRVRRQFMTASEYIRRLLTRNGDLANSEIDLRLLNLI
jgi:hypothetical protein